MKTIRSCPLCKVLAGKLKWKLWHRQVLHHLLPYDKWATAERNLAVGDVRAIKYEDKVRPGKAAPSDRRRLAGELHAAPVAAAQRPQSGVMSHYKQTDDEALNLIHELEATTETQAQLLVEARRLRLTRLQKELAETRETGLPKPPMQK